MKIINDEQLDSLLREVSVRQNIVGQINANVMRTVRKERRKNKCKSVVRLLALCFGVPLLLLLPALALCVVPEFKSSAVTIAVAVSLLFFYVPIVSRLNEIFRQPII